MIGQVLDSYKVQEEIGRGGMGIVYRATDTKLGRDVAIKVLPQSVASDPGRLMRFDREARTLAQVTHPNVGAIHGLQESHGLRYLVLELVPGDTLERRLAEGPLPVQEALTAASQIASALEAAHERGIIHRDLKPANIKITPPGQIKVLDFGLAKIFDEVSMGAAASESSTMTVQDASVGRILGTAAYMSPEQARGMPVDKRTDVWAFGCVLYEMLVGNRPFGGATVSDSIAALLSREPDWQLLPSETPERVRYLLRRCLDKDRYKRLRDIGDAKLEIDDILRSPAPAPAESTGRSNRRAAAVAAFGWFLAGAALIGLINWKFSTNTSGLPGVTRFTVNLPPGSTLPTYNGGLAWSPDGFSLAYRVAGANQMYVRHLDDFEAKPLPGTEGMVGWPSFSPKGDWIAFRQGPKWKKISPRGGPAMNLFDAPIGGATMAAWTSDDKFIFGVNPAAVWRIPVSGGKHEELGAIDPTKSERWGGNPELLPGEKAFLFNLRTKDIESLDELDIAVFSFDTRQRKTLIEGGRNARYLASGHIVYVRGGGLYAVPFDLQRLAVTGPPVQVLDGVYANMVGAVTHYAIASNGSLAYAPGASVGGGRLPVWVSRNGKAQPLPVPPRAYLHPRVSPDGQQVALEVEGPNHDVYVYDLNRSTLAKLTFDGSSHWPLWTPDGKQLTYRVGMPQPFTIWTMPVDRSHPPARLTQDGTRQSAASWSPDGRAVAFTEVRNETGGDIHVLEVSGSRKPTVFAQTKFDEGSPRFSPDGRWIAYCSNESGRNEVYVQAYPGPGPKIQISVDGGSDPVWRRNGGELYYRNGNKMMAVAVNTSGRFQAGKPVMLWEGAYNHGMNSMCGPPGPTSSNYDVTPDGERFLMIQEGAHDAPATELRVVVNWWEEAKSKFRARSGG